MNHKAVDNKTIKENIDRLQGYSHDSSNGLNKCFLVWRIKELKTKLNKQKL
jgi:hypothetical protein